MMRVTKKTSSYKTSGAARDGQPLILSFEARIDTVEGILSVIQEWAVEQGISRDDGLSLRLVLDELLGNICMHGEQPAGETLVNLQLEFLRGDKSVPDTADDPPDRREDDAPDCVRITLRDTAAPFNPFAHEPEPVGDIGSTSVGGRGLTLVRLLTIRADYQWTGSGNRLCLDLPLGGDAGQTAGMHHPASFKPFVSVSLPERLHGFWAGSLALRQTVWFTLSAIILIWGAMTLYLIEVERERAESACALANQAMYTQSAISSAFMARAGREVQNLAGIARKLPQRTSLATQPDALMYALQERAELRTLAAEIPVIGIAAGCGSDAWLYRLKDGGIHRQVLPVNPAPLVADSDASARWESLFIKFQEGGPHAAMFYGVPLTESGKPGDGWIGTVIVMPWISATLKALSGFKNAIPFFINASGQYIIYPSGRQFGEGPQSLSEEALAADAPGLAALERKILAGKKGVTQLRPVLGGDPTPWPLAWEGPTSLAYYPMREPGWHLGLLVSSEELGDAPQPLPIGFFLMAVLGPAAIGIMTWVVTSHTLRPLHELVAALERFGKGDMDAPFPAPRIADEIGVMLSTFERVRVTVRVSFRNLVNSAAAQQRIQNELALARNIQESMLPAVFPTLPWAAVHADIEMSREVCGDLYDCFTPDPGEPSRLCCIMGDVCGKGVPAAIIMSRIMSLARAFQLEGLSPDETLARLNDALLRSDNSSMFVTMLVGIMEPDGTFSWASAGHPPPLLGPAPMKQNGNGFAPQPAVMDPWPGELVLGVRSGQRYTTFTTHLAPGQSLLLYTDGADEAQGPPPAGSGLNELYGEARLTRSFDRACRNAGSNLPGSAQPAAIVDGIRADIMRHMAGQPPVDDISLMVVTRLSESAASGRKIKRGSSTPD